MLSADMEEMALFIKGWAWELVQSRAAVDNDTTSRAAVLSMT